MSHAFGEHTYVIGEKRLAVYRSGNSGLTRLHVCLTQAVSLPANLLACVAAFPQVFLSTSYQTAGDYDTRIQ